MNYRLSGGDFACRMIGRGDAAVPDRPLRRYRLRSANQRVGLAGQLLDGRARSERYAYWMKNKARHGSLAGCRGGAFDHSDFASH